MGGEEVERRPQPRSTCCPGNSPQWRVPASGGVFGQDVGLWRAGVAGDGPPPGSHHRDTGAETPSPSCPLGSAGLACGAITGRQVGLGWAPGEALCQSACPSAGPSGVRLPSTLGLALPVAVIPAPVTSRARNSCSYQAEGQPRAGGLSQARPVVPAQICCLVGRAQLCPQHPEALSSLPLLGRKNHHPGTSHRDQDSSASAAFGQE